MTSSPLPAVLTRRGSALLLLAAVAGCSIDSRDVGVAIAPSFAGFAGSRAGGAGGLNPAEGGADDPSLGVSEGTTAPGAIGSGAATRLVLHDLPESGLVGTPLALFTARFETDAGNVVRQSGVRVGLRLEGGPSDARWVGFWSTETRDGVAMFDAVGIDRPGTYQLSAASSALALESTSASVEVAAPTFVNVATNLPQGSVSSVWAATHEILYALTRSGVFRSDNVGISWTPATFGLRGVVGTLRGSSAEPERVYTTPASAAMGSTAIGGSSGPFFLSRTRDRGRTWRALLPPSFDAERIRALAFDDARQNVAWACSESGVYATEDSGDHWAATFDGECGAIVFGGPAPGALYAYHRNDSGRSLMKSNDDGVAWQTLTAVPNPVTALIAATNGAVYMLSTPELRRSDDAGATWSSTPVDLDRLAIAPSSPERMYGITRRFIRVSVDGGATFDAGTDMRPADVHDLSVDPSDAMRVYAATSRGLLVSTDGGVTWAPPSTGLGGTTDVVAHPTRPGRFLAAGGPLYQSDDSGDSWVRLEDGPADVDRVAFHPDDPDLAYTCGSNVYESRDGAESWTSIATVFNCSGLAMAGSRIWMATPDGVQRSLDGGATWSPTGLDQAASSLAADPGGGTVYAVTTTGAFKSIDAGETWAPMFTSSQVEALALDPTRSSRVWVADCGADGGPLRLSVNSGDTWSSPLGFPARESFSCAQSVQFAGSGALYVLGTDLFVSGDGGSTWSTSPASGITFGGKFAISPDEGTLFVASVAGLFRSSLVAR